MATLRRITRPQDLPRLRHQVITEVLSLSPTERQELRSCAVFIMALPEVHLICTMARSAEGRVTLTQDVAF